MSRSASDLPPFSIPVKVATVSHNATELHVQADADARKALAALWDVPAVEALKADVKVRRWKKDGVRVMGRVTATVVQSCVVTLEPVVSDLDEEFDQTYVPEGSLLARIPANDQGEMVIDPEGPDLPETFSGDTIDVGAIVGEFAALGLDPYPRKPGAEFAARPVEDDTPDRPPSPFAVLKKLDPGS
jgi:uncharacterized metal-binding protein YceD (DUF177 family)